DGIRDFHVTGVQTCALPILAALTNGSVPISLILAVGPFVERVTPAKAENDRVRIVHPRPAALLEAITELVPAEGPACTVEQARRSEERRVGNEGGYGCAQET